MRVQQLAIGVVALVSISFIVASAIVAMSGHSGSAPDRASIRPGPDSGEIPDPQARGVIVLSSGELVTRFKPDGTQLGFSRRTDRQAGASADGRWVAGRSCPPDGGCGLLVGQSFGEQLQQAALPAGFDQGEWSPAGAMFALTDDDHSLYILDPAAGTPVRIAGNVTTFAWTAAGDLVFASADEGGSRTWRVRPGSPVLALAWVPGTVRQLYLSPGGGQVAFTIGGDAGWRLVVIDLRTNALADYGNLGNLPERGAVMRDDPDIAIAWSPDGRFIATSPVAEPYVLFVIDTVRNWTMRHYFDEGYAGELRWSPDDVTLAISTYSPDRSRHEVYLLTPVLGGGPRHLLDGCLIIWSPDGLFLALKREPGHAQGVAVVRPDTGAHWPVVTFSGFLPLSWGVDEATAMEQASRPIRSAAVLAK